MRVKKCLNELSLSLIEKKNKEIKNKLLELGIKKLWFM